MVLISGKQWHKLTSRSILYLLCILCHYKIRYKDLVFESKPSLKYSKYIHAHAGLKCVWVWVCAHVHIYMINYIQKWVEKMVLTPYRHN